MSSLLRAFKIARIASNYGLEEWIPDPRLKPVLQVLIFISSSAKQNKDLSCGTRLRLALQQLGPLFVKFGQGSRTPQNTISQVEDLDRFPIPRYGLNLDIVAASLNTATNNLEITYQNKAPVATYFREISLVLNDDDASYTMPSEETFATSLLLVEYTTLLVKSSVWPSSKRAVTRSR